MSESQTPGHGAHRALAFMMLDRIDELSASLTRLSPPFAFILRWRWWRRVSLQLFNTQSFVHCGPRRTALHDKTGNTKSNGERRY